MRVFFVSSNLYSQFPACFPNAVGSLSAYLKESGHDVHALHLGKQKDMEKLPALLREVQADVVGISAMTCEARIIEPVSKMAKAWNAKVPVICGGIHCIVDPESVLTLDTVDGVCCGEGELAFTEYLEKLENGGDVTETRNFMFRRNGELVRNKSFAFIEDLDTLPPMDRTVADMQQIINANNGVLNVIFSRGCPWSCRFCCNEDIRNAGTGQYSRLMSVPRAMEEVATLVGAYRFSHVLFRDDTFTWNKDWAMEFLDAFARRFGYPYDLFTRVDCLDDDLMLRMRDTNCKHVFLGLDSGNDFIRNEIVKKEQTNEAMIRVATTLKSLGIKPMISNIVGLPFETPEMFADTIEVNKKIHKDVVVFSPTCGACPKIWVFEPWPGTYLHRLCKEQGWLKEELGAHKVYRESVLEMPGFPRKEIEKNFRTFRYKVYKDAHPVVALLFLIYDSKAFQQVFERVPMDLIGNVRQFFLSAMNHRKLLGAFRSSVRPEWLQRSAAGEMRR